MARIIHNENQLTPPAWAGDFFNREHVLPGGAKLDPAAFFDTDAVTVTTTAEATADDTSIAVAALSGPIPSGTILYFGQAKEFAMLTAAANAGATSLTVQALPQTIESGDTATYAGTGVVGHTTVPSGTAVGRTFAERETGDPFGPADAADDEIYLVVWDVTNVQQNNDVELYRHGSLVKENFLPGFDDLDSDVLDYIRANYQTTVGVA